MNRQEAQWLAQVRQRGDAVQGGHVLVACSGGGDSVALLAFLAAVRPALDLTLSVAHVHHGLRPEAEEEAQWVRQLCRHLDLDLAEAWMDVRASAERSGEGLETAARELRWTWLRTEAEQMGAVAVATGHSLDDHTETVLMRLLRGGGTGALTPLPAREGLRWSPLIQASRTELRAYLASRNLGWFDDASNGDPFTIRNRLRPLLDQLRAETPGLDAHLWETHRQVAALESLRDHWLHKEMGRTWEIGEGALHLAPDLDVASLEWILAAGFEALGWNREASVIRPLAAWAGRWLATRKPAVRTWGGWHLEPLSASDKPWRRLVRRG